MHCTASGTERAAPRRAWSQAAAADASRRGEQRCERWTRDDSHTHTVEPAASTNARGGAKPGPSRAPDATRDGAERERERESADPNEREP